MKIEVGVYGPNGHCHTKNITWYVFSAVVVIFSALIYGAIFYWSALKVEHTVLDSIFLDKPISLDAQHLAPCYIAKGAFIQDTSESGFYAVSNNKPATISEGKFCEQEIMIANISLDEIRTLIEKDIKQYEIKQNEKQKLKMAISFTKSLTSVDSE